MANPIVTVNVTQTIAPTPDTLQKRGAMISQGGTTLGEGEYSFLAQESDLTPLLAAPLAISGAVWASTYGGQVTITTTDPHGIPTNTEFVTTIAGFTPGGYNGTFRAWSTGANTFTYYLGSDPGADTVQGTYTAPSVAELEAMTNTFFAQGAQQGVWVLELGAGTVSEGVTALGNFIEMTAPQQFYSYLVPRSWDGNSDFLTFVNDFNGTQAKTYFYVTTNLQNRGLYDDLMKSVLLLVEAPAYSVWSSQSISNATWTGDVATLTTGSAHGIIPGETFTVAGIIPSGYNGTFIALPGTTGSTLKASVADDPGAYSSGGTLRQSYYSSSGVPATEFTHASDFRVTLNYKPSTVNKVTPLSYSFVFGVTPFPSQGNASLIYGAAAALNANHNNYIGTGAEGGISGTILFNGETMDGRPFNYWYATDWMDINVHQALANEIINGSNNPINPLYYNQQGIDRLQQRAETTAASAITYGLALGKTVLLALTGPELVEVLNAGTYAGNVIINAIPFTAYTADNPNDYAQGVYNGISIIFTPQIGFDSITVNINVTDFVSA